MTELRMVLTDMCLMRRLLEEDELRMRLLEPEPIAPFRCFKYGAVEKKPFMKSKKDGDGGLRH